MCLTGHLEGGYPRISARIPAKAGGYPPGDADAGADAAFPGKSNRISASARISGCNATISSSVSAGLLRDRALMGFNGLTITARAANGREPHLDARKRRG
ncbi:hypothetical protein PGTUg99_033102 [Puccinia graminis f. sp. tritici]|uniref:Uncharacterized protein n=1 Tax=Puccinia graminis f. sp. tritici TaxID=56615 RepID=A0A5B0R9X8_PUCGR|nr:hypothetical protein PGTUg99_033102 [Puccinia graminis f. sp. tritici]